MTATIRQIAQRVGLSEPTVSHILIDRGSFRPETRKRVLLAAKEMGYIPNAAARAMRSRRTHQIGVLVANSPHYFGTSQNFSVIGGLNDGLQPHGYVLSIIRRDDIEDRDFGKQSRVFRERMLAELIVLNLASESSIQCTQGATSNVIWADTNVWNPARCIRPDEQAAGRLATEALIRGGARRLVWLSNAFVRPTEMVSHYSWQDRRQGVRQAAEKAGIPLEEIYVGIVWEDAIGDVISPHLRPGVGMIAYDAPRARHVGFTAMSHRLRPGVDFGLACCETCEETRWSWPDLCCTGFDRYAFGRQIAGMVLASQESGKNPQSILVPCELIAGASANCVSHSSPKPTE
ncbi:MAG: LacI family DNA-binding transcriptional regulator [Phycisphaerales bacterium]